VGICALSGATPGQAVRSGVRFKSDPTRANGEVGLVSVDICEQLNWINSGR
jgi:hypothetical protein